MNNELKTVVIYTDGGYRSGSNLGSWGYTATYENSLREDFGTLKYTTNNIMELTAVCEAMEMLLEPCIVQIHSDSMYVVNGFNKWVHGWAKNGWVTRAGADVKNVDVWKRLCEAAERHTVQLQHVKAHCGIPGNERADTICNYAMDTYKA